VNVKPARQPRSIDWDQIKRQLAAAEEALASGYAASAAQRREILRERARVLAQEPAPVASAGPGVEVVEFMLGNERYAIEAAFVGEVLPLKDLTGVPCTPAFVSGIINVHGRILSVIDLKRFFELPEGGLTDLNKVIILQHGDVEFGIVADRIVGASWLSLAELQADFPTVTGARAACLRGVTPQRVVVLDAKRLLTDATMVVDEEVSP